MTGSENDDVATARLERAVSAAETALIEFEIAVETYRIEIENFSRLHEQRLGPLYARLEEIEARIAEAVAARTGDPEDIRKARHARSLIAPMPQVSELFDGWLESEGFTGEAYAMLTDQPVQPPPRVRPGEEARGLYRELVRRAHPDLVTEERERKVRDEFLVRVNHAYALGDAAALRGLAAEWDRRGTGAAEAWRSRGEELAARLEWLAARKEMLAKAAADLEASAIGAMLRLAPEDPDALLREIATDLEGRLAAREAELAALLAEADRGDTRS